MKKQLVRILFGLLLGLCLLPATALAEGEDAPDTLYVGNQQVISSNDITYWTTGTDGKLTKSNESGNWNVKYAPATVTLTLRGATIQGQASTGPAPFGAGIYAPCSSNQSVALTIELIGTNTITGYYGIYVNANQGTTPGADASLVIKSGGDNGDNGILTVTGTGDSGLLIASGTGNASLNIKNVAVTSSTNGDYAAGVCVMSGASATGTPNISLSVDGGSLTANGGSGNSKGIWFYVGSASATNPTTKLTVGGNAIVDAKSGGISASELSADISDQIEVGSGTGNNGGIVFDGTEGTVYGEVRLDESLTINKGETLTIPEGSTLNCNGNLTNKGTILVSGGSVTGDLSDGTMLTTPTIKTQPSGQTVYAGEDAAFTVKASDAQTYQWQQSTDNGQNWTNISDNAASATYTTAATMTMNNYQYRCVVTSSGGVSVISSAATLTVKQPVTGVKLDKTTLNLIVGDTATLKATVEPDNAAVKAVNWASSNTAIATVDAKGEVTAVGPGTATITATAADDSGKSASCTVTVTAKTYCLSIDPGAVGFGTMAPGYTQPAVQEVTVKNTGNQTLSLTHPTAVHFEVGKLNQLTLAPGEKAVFTVRPKAGLPLGSYRETVVVKASGGVEVSVNLTFAVSDGGTGNEKCTLHFNTMGGLPLDDVVRGLGAPVELWPYTPVRVGYLFMGWYSDEALTKAVNTVVLVDDTTIYAKWAVDPAATAAQSGSGTGGSSTGSGSGSGSKATPTPTPTATPAPTPTATPTPAPTATPESTPEVTPAPEETPEKGGFPVFPVAAGGIILVAAAGVFFLLNRRR